MTVFSVIKNEVNDYCVGIYTSEGRAREAVDMLCEAYKEHKTNYAIKELTLDAIPCVLFDYATCGTTVAL